MIPRACYFSLGFQNTKLWTYCTVIRSSKFWDLWYLTGFYMHRDGFLSSLHFPIATSIKNTLISLPCPGAVPKQSLYISQECWVIQTPVGHWWHNCSAVIFYMLGSLPPTINIMVCSLLLRIPGPVKISHLNLTHLARIFCVQANIWKYESYTSLSLPWPRSYLPQVLQYLQPKEANTHNG